VAGQRSSTAGLPLFGAWLIGGHVPRVFWGLFIGKIRLHLPPLSPGWWSHDRSALVQRFGIQYAAGGGRPIGTPAMAGLLTGQPRLVVIFVTLGVKFFPDGLLFPFPPIADRIDRRLTVYALAVGAQPLGDISGSMVTVRRLCTAQPAEITGSNFGRSDRRLFA